MMLPCTLSSASPALISASACRSFTAQLTPPGASCGHGERHATVSEMQGNGWMGVQCCGW